MSKPKIIAFYLPQYHPTPANDRWWGKGFTEWTNVGKAKPLFKGHYQPKVPADLGYYDLRLPEVREAQAQLAREAGVYGFCYYHYWFGNGKRQLELPFNDVLKSGKPNFPFMLCWANESWHKKFWNKDGQGSSKELLIEQTYPGEEDIEKHFYELLPAFKDSRYIKINGKPMFMIYKPFNLPKLKEFTLVWNKLSKQEGLNGIYFIGHLQSEEELDQSIFLKENGIDAINTALVWYAKEQVLKKTYYKWKNKLYKIILKKSIPFNYKLISKYLYSKIDHLPDVFPTLIPNWDHSPRSGKLGYIINNSTPELFYDHIMQTLKLYENQKKEFLFLKSWNEWGEGNYIEPDLKYGKGYINALKRALNEL